MKNFQMTFLPLLFAVLLVTAHSQCSASVTTTFDWEGSTAVTGKKLKELECVKDTQIDFSFAQAASGTLTPTSTGPFTFDTNNNGGSTLQFLDRNGNNYTYNLVEVRLGSVSTAPVTSAPVTPDKELALTYRNTNKNEQVVVVIRLVNPGFSSTDPSFVKNTIKNTYTKFSSFFTFISNLDSGTVSNIASIGVFNLADFGHFYTVFDSSSCSSTILLNAFVYEVDSSITSTTAASGTALTYVQGYTGNKLCWGSLTNTGMFQTHMRESYPLWVLWFTVLFFWFHILFGESHTINCFDRKYENNKWTGYSMYSLWHLAHEEFFSRMSRALPWYMTFSWQACVLGILYGHLGTQYTDASTIIWMAVIAAATSIPVDYIWGFFMVRMYRATLSKYETLRKIKELFDKEGVEARAFEEEVDRHQDTIYNCYYWLYVLCFACYVTFWVLAINRMQLLPREYYYEHKYWLAALGVTLGLYTLVYEPLMTVILGNSGCWKARGYYYDYKLGEAYHAVNAD